MNINHVRNVHDAHVWALTPGQTLLSAHVVIGMYGNESKNRIVLATSRHVMYFVFTINRSHSRCKRLDGKSNSSDGRKISLLQDLFAS